MLPMGAIAKIEPLDTRVQISKGLPSSMVVYFAMYDSGRDVLRVSSFQPHLTSSSTC